MPQLKIKDVHGQLFMGMHLKDTECHLPYGIIQSPDTGEYVTP